MESKATGPSLCTFHSQLFTLSVPRVGIEPTLPAKGRLLYRQPGGPPRVRRQFSHPGFRRSSTGGIRTHTRQGLSLAALPVGVPCLVTSPEPSVGIEPTRPPYQDGKLPLHHKGFSFTASCLLSPVPQERPVGVEPTRPPWQGSRLPLHHGRGSRATITDRAPGGVRTRPAALAWPHASTDTTGASQPTERPAGFAPASPSWEGGMLLLTPRTQSPNSNSGNGGTRTHKASRPSRLASDALIQSDHFRSAPTSTSCGSRTRLSGVRNRRPHPMPNEAQIEQWKRWDSNPRTPA
jgi:hypothetical protein